MLGLMLEPPVGCQPHTQLLDDSAVKAFLRSETDSAQGLGYHNLRLRGYGQSRYRVPANSGTWTGAARRSRVDLDSCPGKWTVPSIEEPAELRLTICDTAGTAISMAKLADLPAASSRTGWQFSS